MNSASTRNITNIQASFVSMHEHTHTTLYLLFLESLLIILFYRSTDRCSLREFHLSANYANAPQKRVYHQKDEINLIFSSGGEQTLCSVNKRYLCPFFSLIEMENNPWHQMCG